MSPSSSISVDRGAAPDLHERVGERRRALGDGGRAPGVEVRRALCSRRPGCAGTTSRLSGNGAPNTRSASGCFEQREVAEGSRECAVAVLLVLAVVAPRAARRRRTIRHAGRAARCAPRRSRADPATPSIRPSTYTACGRSAELQGHPDALVRGRDPRERAAAAAPVPRARARHSRAISRSFGSRRRCGAAAATGSAPACRISSSLRDRAQLVVAVGAQHERIGRAAERVHAGQLPADLRILLLRGIQQHPVDLGELAPHLRVPAQVVQAGARGTRAGTRRTRRAHRRR